VHFYCSLRVSECAALRHEDIYLDFENPSLSKVTVRWHVDWPREKGLKAEILPGFKNSKALENQVKVLAIFPEAFKVLKEIWISGSKELVFKNGDTFFEYREIENAYNNAFEQAQLPYTGTHIMRHGGTTWLFDESGGDASLCQLQLGVVEMNTVFTYVKRNKDALNNFSQKIWEKQTNGRDWLQVVATNLWPHIIMIKAWGQSKVSDREITPHVNIPTITLCKI
jgi:integrase